MKFSLTIFLNICFITGSAASIVMMIKHFANELLRGIEDAGYIQPPWKDMCTLERLSWLVKSIIIFAIASLVPIAVTATSIVVMLSYELPSPYREWASFRFNGSAMGVPCKQGTDRGFSTEGRSARSALCDEPINRMFFAA